MLIIDIINMKSQEILDVQIILEIPAASPQRRDAVVTIHKYK